MRDFLTWMGALPEPALYVLLAVGAAIENVIPAVPADTFVALGGLLSAVGDLSALGVFLATWLSNVASALAVYRLGFKHGRSVFETHLGRYVLKPHQLARMEAFYARFGLPAIFLTRFLPGLRSIVPIFAGVTKQRWILVAPPLALASAIWYGALVWMGAWAGQNLDLLGRLLGRVQTTLLVIATVLGGAAGFWWWHSRHAPRE